MDEDQTNVCLGRLRDLDGDRECLLRKRRTVERDKK